MRNRQCRRISHIHRQELKLLQKVYAGSEGLNVSLVVHHHQKNSGARKFHRPAKQL